MSRVLPARAYRAGAFTIPQNAWTRMPLDTLVWDTGGDFELPGYVCPVGAFYHVIGQMSCVATIGTETIGVAIYRNGASICVAGGTTPLSSGLQGILATDVIRCSIGDVLELWAFTDANTGQALTIRPDGNYLTIASAV